ncbi:lipopolysaccharide biosynthesis protein [Bacillus albus]|uniref:lipopolysaccharide biosynthesis protein n=1 Tax=Bacillus TaxID=1386 RepID=UPI000BF52BB8|nr:MULTISPECIES: lipopolysaccharide biosynthesis protein [Bacillus cereus group]PFM46158.1 lipopolysaccharide biosynthesis protein [Bacillus cereus]MDA2215221.1 lipopolysaccharide biosynthesis protein [Bacillus cereus group sp. Bc228]MDA2227177.1 lipopolysaccharide biosynthesis protein [Bacillus cereus group sp. Bc227]MDA2259870.1 lipopolysaccharide biosynthesis protein [Bacillus cereus group sp. Bc200]MDA2321254.1 lipopolysaccharide biosynthesis protein [Bacillus cereus group sp. Bc177]
MNFLKNSLWSILNIIGVQLVGLIVNVILARLLYPEIFGILGMAYVFAGFIIVFQDAGLSSYLIFKSTIDKRLINTTFVLNIFTSFLLAIFLLLTSDLVGGFYNEILVSKVIEVLSIGVAIGGLGITSRALLIREKKFKVLTIIDIISEVSSSVVAIVLAICHQDIWAVTSRLVIKPMFQTVILLLLYGKQVIGKPSYQYMFEIIPYSSKFLGSQMFIYLNNNVDYLLIGKFLGSKSLGLYTMAYQWSVVARQYISGAINRVIFPEVASLQSDVEKIRKLYLTVISKVAFFTFPLCAGLLVISREFILFVYSDKWIEAVFPLQILLVVGLVTSIGTLGGSIFNGLGKPQLEMRLNMGSFVFLTIMICILKDYGLNVLAIGILVKTIIFDYIKILLVNQQIKSNMWEFFESLKPSFLCTAIMVVCLVIFKGLVSLENTSMLFLQICIGILIYFISTLIFNKEIILFFRKRKK